jgi:hypothetical protein
MIHRSLNERRCPLARTICRRNKCLWLFIFAFIMYGLVPRPFGFIGWKVVEIKQYTET